MLADPVQNIVSIFLPCWLAQHKVVASGKLIVVENGVALFVFLEIAQIEMGRDFVPAAVLLQTSRVAVAKPSRKEMI